MDDQLKYHLRLVTKSGNAFEAITYMDFAKVMSAIRNPDEGGFAHIEAVNQVKQSVYLLVKAEPIEGVMHQIAPVLHA